MNRDGHLLSSMYILICIMGSILFFFLVENEPLRVAGALMLSFIAFLMGCLAPDLDHPKVHEKIFFLKWLGRVTHHRGHFHSIVASLVYGGFIYFFMWLWNVFFWIPPVVFGIIGFISHLIEDDLNRYKLEKKPKRGFKIW